MAHVNILKFGVSSPADTSPLKRLKAAGYDSSSILAVIGKSEGKHLPVLPRNRLFAVAVPLVVLDFPIWTSSASLHLPLNFQMDWFPGLLWPLQLPKAY